MPVEVPNSSNLVVQPAALETVELTNCVSCHARESRLSSLAFDICQEAFRVLYRGA